MSNTKQTKRLTRHRSEALLTLLETLPGALFVVDEAAMIVYVNASAQAMLGAPPEKFVGNSFWRSAPHLVSTALYQAMLTTRQTQEPTEVEYVSPVTQNWLHVQLAPTVGGLTLHFHEKREPLPRRETFFPDKHLAADVLENMYVWVGCLTPEGILLDINETPLEDAQIRREEVIGKPFAETPWWSFSPASQHQLRTAITRTSKGETVRFETQVHPREERNLHLEVMIIPHLDADHHVEYLIIAGIDITARKRAEADIHALIDAIPQLVWTGRSDGYVDYYNQRWRDYTGMTTQEAQGNGWMQCTHPDDRQRVLAVWQRAVQTGRPYEAEQRLRQSTTGAYRWFLVQATPFKDAQGTILKYIGTCTDIDEQKRAEQRLKESWENFRVLAETVPQLVWTTRPDGRQDYCNQRFCDLTQVDSEQLWGDGWRQFLHPDDHERTLTIWRHALETGEPYEVEYRLKEGQTGAYRWFLARGMPMRDNAGQIVKWFGTCTDIHEKKQAEDEIRDLVDAIPQFVWIMRPDGSAECCNQQWCDYTNMTCEQLQGDGWIQCLHPDERQRVLEAWQTSVHTGTSYEVEHRFRNGNTGEYRWFLARGRPHKDAQGKILKWFGTCTDIEDQKRVEQQLKESQENWRVLTETVPQLVWTIRPDGQHEYVNQRWCDYTGSTLEHMQSDRWNHLQLIHPDDQEGNRATLQHALETGGMFEHEERLRNGQTGEYRWFLVRAMPVRDKAGQIIKWLGTCTDIEDQKRIEEALRQSQERASVLMNSNIIGINIIEGEQIVDANDTFLRMTGYSREDLHAGRMNWLHMTPPEYLAPTRQAHQELTTQQSMTYEKEYVCQDGSRLPVLVCGVLLQHHPRQAIAFVLDNSARKELEQRKDDFISMASHELRNPLTALKMQTQLVQKRLERQSYPEAATALSRVEGPVKQLERLIRELLDVSKIQAGRLEYVREQVDLDELLQEVTATIHHLHPSHTILVRGAVQTSLIGDRDRVGQVFTNLLSNAIKYSPGAETVEMDLSASEDTVTIRVQDHGLGIPREQCDKIFERFYRVTGSRQRAIPGLGMGLYIVAEIVKHHGGSITVDSEVGKGSTFTVTFPKRRDA